MASSDLAAFLAAFLAGRFFLGFGLGFIFEDTAVRQDDTFGVFVEFDYLEGQFLFELSLSSILFYQVLGSSETFYTVGQCDYGTLVEHLDDCTFVNRVNGKDVLEYVPGILFELFVTEAETTVLLVDFEHLNFDVGTDLSELRGVFDFLRPRKVGDVDKTVYALFEFNKYTEVGEVANFGVVTRTHGIFLFDIFPGIGFELF